MTEPKNLCKLINEAASYPLEMRIAAWMYINDVVGKEANEVFFAMSGNGTLDTIMKIENYLEAFILDDSKVTWQLRQLAVEL